MLGFRVWDTEQRLMVSEYGDYSFCLGTDGDVYVMTDCPVTDHDHIGKNLIPMQSTGIKDSAGKEIFEGDILCYKNHSGTSYMAVQDFHFFIRGYCLNVSLMARGPGSIGLIDKHVKELSMPCLIVGNIYESPDLLEKCDARI